MYALSRVQLFEALRTAAYQASLSVEIFQAKILEWVAMPSSRGSSGPRDQICIFCIGRQILYHCATWEASVLLRILEFP